LAVSVIFAFLLISVTFPSSPDLTKQKALANTGEQALLQLDGSGALGNLIAERNWTALKQSLDTLIPSSVSFNLTVYDENSRPVNSQLIQNASPVGTGMVAVQYVCASETPNVQFFTLRLQLAEVG
jgi:hypothetical protein